MTRYLVIGGNGFIGRHVVRQLAETGADVTTVGRKHWDHDGVRVKSRRVDLTDTSPAQFAQIVEAADVTFHLAWTSIQAPANLGPIDDLYQNGKMTLELLEALRRRGSGRLVFASSGGTVYGRLHTVPAPESHPLNPITAYGVSKLACEKYLQLYRYLHSVDVRIARIANPYGAGQNPFRKQGAVSTFIFKAMEDVPIEVWGDGNTVRDFIYISDLVASLRTLADADLPDHEEPHIYNIGGGESHTINDVISMIERLLGRPVTSLKQPSRTFDVPVSLLCIDKARRDLNWSPKFGLRAGMSKMIADLREEPRRHFAD